MSLGIRGRMNPYRLYLFGMTLPVSLLGAFAGTTMTVYYVESGHLNPLQLVALGTAVELSYFAMQLPTGALADLAGRRLCVALGWLLLGAGFAEQGLSPPSAIWSPVSWCWASARRCRPGRRTPGSPTSSTRRR